MQGHRRTPRRGRGRLTQLAAAWLVIAAVVALPSADAAEETATPDRQVLYRPILDSVFPAGEPSNVADLLAMEEHVRELSKNAIASVVSVRVGQAQGSGVIVSPDGHVLTAAHVVGEPNLRASITLSDGRRLSGVTLGRDSAFDAGMVKITDTMDKDSPSVWPSAELGNSADLKPGAWCLAIGHPGGYQRNRAPVIRFGRVLSISRGAIMTDCKLVGGDSGGPLFDMNGRVVGIHSRIGSSLTTNLHVPVSTYRNSWDRLARGDAWGDEPDDETAKPKPAQLGIQGSNDDPRAIVTKVLANTAAERGGIQVGDLVLRFQDLEVRSFEELSNMVSRTRPGQPVRLVVQRGQRLIQLTFKMGAGSS